MSESDPGGEFDIVLLCGLCHDKYQALDGREERKVLAVVTVFGRAEPGEPEPWFIKVKLPERIHRDEHDVDTWMLLGDDHRWLQMPWAIEGYPLEFKGCGRHRFRRNRAKLAPAIRRAAAKGERSLYVRR